MDLVEMASGSTFGLACSFSGSLQSIVALLEADRPGSSAWRC